MATLKYYTKSEKTGNPYGPMSAADRTNQVARGYVEITAEEAEQIRNQKARDAEQAQEQNARQTEQAAASAEQPAANTDDAPATGSGEQGGDPPATGSGEQGGDPPATSPPSQAQRPPKGPRQQTAVSSTSGDQSTVGT